MATKQKQRKKKAGKITLLDVIIHMQAMEQRLAAQIMQNTKDIKANTEAIHILTECVDALNEDLTATMKDMIHVRRHVGMAIPEEEEE